MNRLTILIFSIMTALSIEPSNAQNLNEIQLDGLKILIEEHDSSNIEFNLEFEDSKNREVQAIIVDNPTRIVLDIFGFTLKGGKNIQLSSSILKQARIGIHKDKVRIVFDSSLKEIKKIEKSPNETLKFIATAGVKKEENKISKEEIKTQAEPKTEPKETPQEEETIEINKETNIQELGETSSTEKSLNQNVETVITPSLNKEELLASSPTPVITTIPSPSASLPIKTIETKDEEKLKDKEIKIDHTKDESPKETKAQQENTQNTTTKTSDPQIKPSLIAAPEENESIKDVEKKLTPAIIEKSSEKNTNTADLEKSEPVTGSAIIKSIVFQTTAEKMQSSIVVSTSEAVSYTINQISTTEYDLVIPGTKLKGEHLKLAQYPPDSFKGFLYFTASDTETETHIKIKIEEGVKLTPYLENGKLWIRAD